MGDRLDHLIIVLPPRRVDAFLRLGRRLGEGGFGTVFQGVATAWGSGKVSSLEAGRAYAVKRVQLPQRGFPDEVSRSVLAVSPERHVEFLRTLYDARCESNCIVRLVAMFLEVRNVSRKMAYQVMEILEGPDLFDFISGAGVGIKEHVAGRLASDMFTAVHYLHRVVGVLHRDIKPENFGFVRPLRSDAPLPTLKLFDFGLAWILVAPVADDTASVVLPLPPVGTPLYMAPESWEGRTGPPSDIWGVGLIVFLLLALELPFRLLECVDIKSSGSNFLQRPLVFDVSRWKDASAEAQTFVSSLLDKDPAQRAVTSGILADPWLQMAADSEASASSGSLGCPCPEPPASPASQLLARSAAVESLLLPAVSCAAEQFLRHESGEFAIVA